MLPKLTKIDLGPESQHPNHSITIKILKKDNYKPLKNTKIFRTFTGSIFPSSLFSFKSHKWGDGLYLRDLR